MAIFAIEWKNLLPDWHDININYALITEDVFIRLMGYTINKYDHSI